MPQLVHRASIENLVSVSIIQGVSQLIRLSFVVISFSLNHLEIRLELDHISLLRFNLILSVSHSHSVLADFVFELLNDFLLLSPL